MCKIQVINEIRLKKSVKINEKTAVLSNPHNHSRSGLHVKTICLNKILKRWGESERKKRARQTELVLGQRINAYVYLVHTTFSDDIFKRR